MSLDKQINIYSVDTGNFYSNNEARLHWKGHKIKSEKKVLKEKQATILDELSKYNITKYDFEAIALGEYVWGESTSRQNKKITDQVMNYLYINELIKDKNRRIRQTKEKLLTLLSNKVETNIITGGRDHIRKLNESSISDKNIISVFESSLTRMMNLEQDDLTDNFIVVQVYYFDIIKDLIHHGFTYKGEKYIFFTASAGQIRTKKTVFIKESIWKDLEKTIMCGLTIDLINAKGGNNPNKHLAYMALANSATDVWTDFDIDKTIVVDDFETEVLGTYDLIDDNDYSIKRITGKVPVPHTDGAGMMLPHLGKNRMIRLPWIKGLLGVFDFERFIDENLCSPIIRDIYGDEHDVLEEGIKIIFTKSQFKMWKYYDNWQQYKDYFKAYNCSAGYTNMEEERISNTSISYQMLQTLTDITDEELNTIASKSISRLENLCSSVDDMKRAFGVTVYNQDKTYLQEAIDLYPNLLNDEYLKNTLREIKNSMVKRYKSGKLEIEGKYTFILPDFYAACQYWFSDIKNPKGLLGDGEVFCWLFRKAEKLDCLRSPHLYKEHAIRINTAYRENPDKQTQIRKWFTTDALYTSCHDLISKVLQFDVDGDKSLVISDPTIVSVAERNMEGIVPLYYNMRKADPTILNSESIYEGLKASFSGNNIGLYSNLITKIWNNDIFVSGTEKEKQELLDIIKILCMENNFCIDSAKTLYMPTRPQNIKEQISKYTNGAVPYFFINAKDKTVSQVAPRNKSIVNKLETLIPNPRINTRKTGLKEIDHTLLMSNPDIACNATFLKNGKLDPDASDPLIVKYLELNKNYHHKINMKRENIETDHRNILSKTQIKNDLYFRRVAIEIRAELSQFGYTPEEIADILVKYLYGIKQNVHKESLWFCYGSIVLNNLRSNVTNDKRTKQCIDCGEWFETGKSNKRTCRCRICQEESTRLSKRRWKNRKGEL